MSQASPEHLEIQPESKAAIHRRLPLLIPSLIVALGCFLATAFVYHPNTGWNVNTRLALIFAVADMGTLSIDDYHGEGMPTETGDKAVFEGRYYSDKIFGVSVLALPAYWLARTIHGESLPFAAAHWLCRIVAVSLPAALSVVLLLHLMVQTGCPPRRALVAVMGLFFGSIWFGYSTIFFPYAPALAASLGALYLVFYPPGHRLTAFNSGIVGFLLGFALLCELTMCFLVAAIGMVWLLRLADQTGYLGMRAFAEMAGERTRLLHAAGYGVTFWIGVLLPLSLFAVYCHAIFGEFTIPYEYEASELFREGMQRGVMGIEAPRLAPLHYLTIHPYRGIFFWSPVLTLALLGCCFATRQYGKRRIVGWVGLYTAVAYLLFNAGYYMWWGGWAMGPRFLIPMIPVVGLGLGEMLREGKLSAFAKSERIGRVSRYAVYTFLVLGVLHSLPLSLTEPQIPQGNPTEVLLAPTIKDGLSVPQAAYLSSFYQGKVSLEPTVRLSGAYGTDSPVRNYLSILLYVALLLILPLVIAWRLLPASLPGVHRRDYPFATVDGTAAPPPPVRVV